MFQTLACNKIFNKSISMGIPKVVGALPHHHRPLLYLDIMYVFWGFSQKLQKSVFGRETQLDFFNGANN
jgi:hypothetical protein